jgi:predicted outer membrane protein
MKKLTTIALVALLAACSANKDLTPAQKEVLNSCAQQNFQCESSCENTNMRDNMANGVCMRQCIDQHNACKAQLGPEFIN